MGTKTIELKVGVFILIGITIFFIIVFSISDIYFIKPGYRINILFNFASGLARSAPVRLAGVNVGQVETIDITYDKESLRSKAFVRAWIKGGTNIEEDSEITINTLGLLGEKYLEIFPGTGGKGLLKEGSTVTGHDPVSMEKVTENIKNLSDSVTVIVKRLEKGEGTVGKLLAEDAVYDDLKATAANFKDFSEDIKKHPWKLLSKPRGQ